MGMESLPRMRLQMEIASSPVKSENWLMNSTILSSASHTYGPRLYIIDVVGTIADKERLIPQLEGNFDKAAVEYYTANGVSQKKAEAKLALNGLSDSLKRKAGSTLRSALSNRSRIRGGARSSSSKHIAHFEADPAISS